MGEVPFFLFFSAGRGLVPLRKLKKYEPSRFMGEGSSYNGELADLAVAFIGCLKHTKGEWYGQNFELGLLLHQLNAGVGRQRRGLHAAGGNHFQGLPPDGTGGT